MVYVITLDLSEHHSNNCKVRTKMKERGISLASKSKTGICNEVVLLRVHLVSLYLPTSTSLPSTPTSQPVSMAQSHQQDDYDYLPQTESSIPLLETEAEKSQHDVSQRPSSIHFRTRFRKAGLISLALGGVLLLVMVTVSLFYRRANDRVTLQRHLQTLYPHHRIPSKIPSLIWQTWKNHPGDEKFPEHLVNSVKSWSRLNPNHTQINLNDAQAMELVQSIYTNAPQVLEAYKSMPLNVQRADFFRYLILFALGGTYTDVDTSALKPIQQWLDDSTPEEQTGIIIGIEVDAEGIPNWADLWARKLQFCQWTIVSKPGHPILADIIARITQDTLDMKKGFASLTPENITKSTLEYTGPGVWTDVIFDHFKNAAQFTKEDKEYSSPLRIGSRVKGSDISGLSIRKRIGDVVILPITSFSPGEGRMGSEAVNHPMAFVKHHFQGKFVLYIC
jgi:alpha 1,6-mannosyltransferase